MNKPKIRTVAAVVLPALLAAVCAGCGASAASTLPADPAAARQALREALDAWKRGESPGATDPGVRVIDDDWSAGGRLIDYRIAAEGDPVGTCLRAPVVLTLRGSRGRAFRKAVVYDVATGPTATVVRHE